MDAKDRRRYVRRTLLASAEIIPLRGEAVRCELQNISEGGGMIALDEQAAELPAQFLLQISGNITVTRRCRLAWRNGMMAGVEFLCRTKKAGAPRMSPA